MLGVSSKVPQLNPSAQINKTGDARLGPMGHEPHVVPHLHRPQVPKVPRALWEDFGSPRASSEGFLSCTSSAGAKLHVPRPCGRAAVALIAIIGWDFSKS